MPCGKNMPASCLMPSARMPRTGFLPCLPGAENVFWRFPFKVPEGHEFAKFMNRYGIDVTTTLLPCCSQLEIFRSYAAPTPHACGAVRETYFLPIEHWLSEKQVTALAEAAVAFVRAGA